MGGSCAWVAAAAAAVLTGSETAFACDGVVSFARGSDAAAGTPSSPWKTVAHALDKITAGTVCLRGDRITEPLHVSHTTGPLTLTAFPADLVGGLPRPIISGGTPIGPFSPPTGGEPLVTAAAPRGVAVTSVLWEDGKAGWLQRARSPNGAAGAAAARARHFDNNSTFHWARPLENGTGGTFPAIDKMGFVFDAKDRGSINPELHAVADIQVLHFHSWTAFWSDVAAIDAANSTLVFAEPAISAIGQYAKQGGQRFILENVREGLDAPGEWYWDAVTHTVSLYPRPGTDVSTLQLLAPTVPTLLQVYGVEGLTVTDLEFRHADCGKRVGNYFAPSNNAAILVGASSGVYFERVSVSDSGGFGWTLQSNTSDVAIVNCSATNLGADGITIPDQTAVSDISISHCVVNNTALVFLGQPGGISLRGEGNITVVNSSISFVPYAGIKVGWQNGFDAAHGAIGRVPPAFRVENNKITDFGLGVLSDFGGVYMSSNDNLCFQKDPTTCYLPARVHGNEIARCEYYNYGCNGVYMDEQVSGVDITSNVVYDIGDTGVYFHCGSDNRADGNIFAACGIGGSPSDSVLGGCNAGGNPTWPNLPHGFNFTRNIVYFENDRMVSSYEPDWRATVFDYNVYWSPNASTLAGMAFPAQTTWSSWRAGGNDTHSIEQDPLFRDAANRDFTLLAGSPALALGVPQTNQASTGSRNTPLPHRGA